MFYRKMRFKEETFSFLESLFNVNGVFYVVIVSKYRFEASSGTFIRQVVLAQVIFILAWALEMALDFLPKNSNQSALLVVSKQKKKVFHFA